MAKTTLKELLRKTDKCVLAPCVYDCASARAIELAGFSAMMLSGGELSLAMNGVIDFGFNNLTDIEWMVGRLSLSSSLALAVDIEDGFGGPLAVYRTCKRLARAGAHAVQLEDSAAMDDSTRLLPAPDYDAKVKAAVAALKGTDCILIARTNADPATRLDEGCARLKKAVELGADMTTLVKLDNLQDAKYVANKVPGWKMYPDVKSHHGVPEVTVEEVFPLGFNFMTMHFLLKAAMDGMLEHAVKNFKQHGNVYTCEKQDATGVMGDSATPLFDPRSYMELESGFTGRNRDYRIVGNAVPPFPQGFKKVPIKYRF